MATFFGGEKKEKGAQVLQNKLGRKLDKDSFVFGIGTLLELDRERGGEGGTIRTRGALVASVFLGR